MICALEQVLYSLPSYVHYQGRRAYLHIGRGIQGEWQAGYQITHADYPDDYLHATQGLPTQNLYTVLTILSNKLKRELDDTGTRA